MSTSEKVSSAIGQICIVEIAHHYEVVVYVEQVLSSTYQLVTKLRIASYDARPAASAKEWVKQLCQDADVLASTHLIVTTLGLDRRIWEPLLKLGKKCFAFIHNGHYSFASRPPRLRGFNSLLKRLKYRAQPFWKARLVDRQGWTGFVLPTERMVPLLLSFGVKRPLLAIPWVLQNEPTNQQLRADGPLSLVIPGTVRANGREWAPVLQLISQCMRPLEIYFLGTSGTSFGRELRRKANAQNLAHQLHFFDELLSRSDYQECCANAHVFLLPISAQTEYASVAEQSGESKISGGEQDHIRWSRPALVSAGYQGNPAYTSLQQRYQDGSELVDCLHRYSQSALEAQRVSGLSQEHHLSRWSAFLTGTFTKG